ncbi:MAG: hypothetical protein BGO01_00830 [Armatimonadetes bacterium 55-13]|nr:MAG: hypothetical protein BGO01_00830 [Armatimonadetes bacterium 55-13]
MAFSDVFESKDGEDEKYGFAEHKVPWALTGKPGEKGIAFAEASSKQHHGRHEIEQPEGDQA